MGLRELILKADDLPREAVVVKEWKDEQGNPLTVYIRSMTGVERDAFENETYKLVGKDMTFNRQNFRARLLGRTLVDEKGVRIFNDAELVQLGGKAAKVLDRLSTIASRLSGISEKDKEELLGNSNAGPSAGNGSGSQTIGAAPSASASSG